VEFSPTNLLGILNPKDLSASRIAYFLTPAKASRELSE
jgi:hypothetical protein